MPKAVWEFFWPNYFSAHTNWLAMQSYNARTVLDMTHLLQSKNADLETQAITGTMSQSLTVPSAKAEMTFPKADNDLLMFLASSRTAPSAPVLLTWQWNSHMLVSVTCSFKFPCCYMYITSACIQMIFTSHVPIKTTFKCMWQQSITSLWTGFSRSAMQVLKKILHDNCRNSRVLIG